MDALPDAIVQHILSSMKNAKEVASCSCVSKHWKDAMPFVQSLYFPRNSFNETCNEGSDIVGRMIESTIWLEELVIYCPFSNTSLNSRLSSRSPSLRHLELRMDDLAEKRITSDTFTKLDCINAANGGLESLKLWGVLMIQSPNWGVFHRLHTLEIVGVRLRDNTLSATLRSCPNLTNLALLCCDGVRLISVDLPQLEQCRLDFYGLGDYSLYPLVLGSSNFLRSKVVIGFA